MTEIIPSRKRQRTTTPWQLYPEDLYADFPVLSTPPTGVDGRVYYDDGTNTGDAAAGLRQYNGSAWTDVRLLNTRGTWTATLTCGTGSVTISTNMCSWTRVGSLVFVTAYINIASVSSPSGSLTLGGLPFAVRNNFPASGAFTWFPVQANSLVNMLGQVLRLRLREDENTALFGRFQDANPGPLQYTTTVADRLQATTLLWFQLTYDTDE